MARQEAADARRHGFQAAARRGCRCGTVHYQVSAAPLLTFACGCTDCQQLTSSAVSLDMAAPKPGFTLNGQDGLRCWIKKGGSGEHARRCACAGWTHTEADSTPDVVIVRPTK